MNDKEESLNQNPITSNFIFGKEINNNGKIISSGKRPVNVIRADKYSGKGTVETKQILQNEIKFYEEWWFKFILTIIGGLIVAYLIFKLGWSKQI